MKILMTLALSTALSLGLAPLGMSQELEQIGDRQCAPAGSALHDDLNERSPAPNCFQYCTVDKSEIPEYRDFPGLVFSCAKLGPPGVFLGVEEATTQAGLSVRSGGVLLGLALLLGLAAGGGGSTNGTN